MLSYFEKSKGKLNLTEDALTSLVFDSLKYLPSEIFWRILKRSFYNDKLPANPGELKEMLFWEKWNVSTSEFNANSRYVEPDVFIRGEDFDLIIESKRYDLKQQRQNQLEEQIKGYFYNFSEDNKKLYYLQMGGLNSRSDEADFLYPYNIDGVPTSATKVPIVKTDWKKLLIEITAEQKMLSTIPYSYLANHIRILNDLIQGMEMFQLYVLSWLTDLTPRNEIDKQFKDYFNYVK